jgi:hypothetical protein
MRSEWLEPALEIHLERVRAPEELWERIQNPRVERHRPARQPAAGMTVCLTIAVVLLAVWFYPWHKQLRSGDPGEIRAWVRTQAGVDVPLLARPSGRIQLTGARVVKNAAEISYRVGDHGGRLVVAKGVSGGRHTLPAGTRVFTWSMDGHVYTLACAEPDDLRIACSLCHIG